MPTNVQPPAGGELPPAPAPGSTAPAVAGPPITPVPPQTQAPTGTSVADASSLVPIPGKLAKRPRLGGLPIPFVSLIMDGKPDFRVNDPILTVAAMKGNRCGICGGILDYWKVFFGDANAMDNHRLFTEPGAHEECMEYALQVCPFLHGKGRRETNLPHEVLVEFSTPYAPKLPDTVYIGFTRSYEVVKREGIYYARVAPIHHRKEIKPYE